MGTAGAGAHIRAGGAIDPTEVVLKIVEALDLDGTARRAEHVSVVVGDESSLFAIGTGARALHLIAPKIDAFVWLFVYRETMKARRN